MSGAESGRSRQSAQKGTPRSGRPVTGARAAPSVKSTPRGPVPRQHSGPQSGRHARTRASRWRTAWRAGRLAAFLVALVLSGVLSYLLLAGAFSVRRLDVNGTALTSPDDVAAAGEALGQNIFTVDPQVVAQRLVGLPAIQQAQVSLLLPDRLVIHIMERQPALVWQVGADRYLLDASGVVIAQNPPATFARDLPGVTAHDLAAPAVGGRVDPALVQASLAVARRAAQFGLHVTAFDYSPATGLTLQLTDAPPITIGGASRLDDKLAAVAAVLRDDPDHGQHWQSLNVTDPDRPFFTVK
jgi:hypothetical protein